MGEVLGYDDPPSGVSRSRRGDCRLPLDCSND